MFRQLQKYEDAKLSKLLCEKSNTSVHIITYDFNMHNGVTIILQTTKTLWHKTMKWFKGFIKFKK